VGFSILDTLTTPRPARRGGPAQAGTKIVRWPPPPIVAGIPSESRTGIRSGSVTVYAGIRTGGIIIWNRESQMESWLKSCLGVDALEVFGRSARAGVEV
jgi:membrane-associated protease RseP (regulator of RpoE activity)